MNIKLEEEVTKNEPMEVKPVTKKRDMDNQPKSQVGGSSFLWKILWNLWLLMPIIIVTALAFHDTLESSVYQPVMSFMSAYMAPMLRLSNYQWAIDSAKFFASETSTSVAVIVGTLQKLPVWTWMINAMTILMSTVATTWAIIVYTIVMGSIGFGTAAWTYASVEPPRRKERMHQGPNVMKQYRRRWKAMHRRCSVRYGRRKANWVPRQVWNIRGSLHRQERFNNVGRNNAYNSQSSSESTSSGRKCQS